MTTLRSLPTGWRWLPVAALAWALLAGSGLCAGTPEPLRNRTKQPEATSPDGASTVTTAPGAAGSGSVILVPGGAAASGTGGASATGAGGNQDATVNVNPPAVGVVVPGVVVPGAVTPVAPGGLVPATETKPGTKDGEKEPGVVITPPAGGQPTTPAATGKAEPAPGKASPAPGQAAPDERPLTVKPGTKVLDVNGQPVPVPPGQEVVLPQGGKLVDANGRVTPIPPGGRVIMEQGQRPLTPGDFLPKVQGALDPAKPAEKATPDAKPARPGAKAPKDKAAKSPPPEAAPKPQAAAPPRPGEHLRLDDEVCAKHSLDFLAGCWRGRAVLRDRTQVSTRLCFDAHGVGKRIDKYLTRPLECVAPMQAAWNGDSLSFSFKDFHCSDGRPRTDVPVVCKGCGQSTRCIGSEYRSGGGMVGKTTYEIVRE